MCHDLVNVLFYVPPGRMLCGCSWSLDTTDVLLLGQTTPAQDHEHQHTIGLERGCAVYLISSPTLIIQVLCLYIIRPRKHSVRNEGSFSLCYIHLQSSRDEVFESKCTILRSLRVWRLFARKPLYRVLCPY